jgi:hypothetical protein
VSGEEKESLASAIETGNKNAIGRKCKRSSKKDKFSIQDSSSESDMEIEFESAGISDGDAEWLFCTGLFSHDKHGEKWAQCVRCCRWALEDCGVEKDYFVCPMCKKKCKIVTYITKYYLILGHHSYLREKCHVYIFFFCTETCVLLQIEFCFRVK